MHTLSKAKSFVEEQKYALAMMAMPIAWEVQSAVSSLPVFANSTVKVPEISVSDDGTVDLGASGGGDVKQAFNSVISNSQFVLGAIITVASLIVLGYGLWKAQKAAKELQDNSPMGWQSAGAILKGTIVAGLLFAVIGVVLAASAATGANMFGG